jgi:hypothetical protein
VTVLARDQHGAEHQLEVLVQHGLVVLRDNAQIRILTPQAAIELAMLLAESSMPAVPPGPISSTF